MSARNWIVPGLVFFAGAVFGRVFGIKPLVKGAMTIATMSGMLPDERRAPARAVAHGSVRRRSTRRRAS
jgi:hypothetical protein